MSFFKKGDKVLIKYCCIREYIGLTGTVISHTKDSADTLANIRIAIDEKFHNALNKSHWVTKPTFYDKSIDLVLIRGAKILKNE